MAAVTTRPAVALRASAPTRLVAALAGPPTTATVLARFPTALYLGVPRAFGVIALLARDAVRLPCGLVLARDFSPDRVDGPALVGDGAVRVGDLDVAVGRVVSVVVGRRARARPELVRATAVRPADVTRPRALLGFGEGLTPSGDDVLAGYLAGAAAYGLPVDGLRALIAAEGGRTTILSAALLRHAAAGEAIPQVVGLLDALAGVRPLDAALAELLAVGHTSGLALARGVLAAAVAT